MVVAALLSCRFTSRAHVTMCLPDSRPGLAAQAAHSSLSLDSTRGHVFVVHGDVRKFAADAVLMPTRSLNNPKWFPDGPPPGASGPTRSYFASSRRVVKVSRSLPFQGPDIWLGHLDGRDAPSDACDFSGRPRLQWFMEAARQFVYSALADLRSRPQPPRYGRAKHLIAMPVVGTGTGGARDRSGDVIARLLLLLQEFVLEADIDVALVVKGETMFSAAQALRREVDGAGPRWGELLSKRLCAHAETLAERAANEQLCLFLGAGVSIGAGLPRWQELLTSIAAREELGMSAEEVEQLSTLKLFDQAAVLASRLGGSESRLQELVADECSADLYSLTHGLLAGLPVNAVVTTNYDSLFEKAWDGAAAKYTVLPYETQPSERFILKLHGDVRRPEDIVITRTQMRDSREQRPALSGIVETILLTKHMLFIGFSLQDPNFSELAGAVRRAQGRGKVVVKEDERTVPDAFGTLLMLQDRPLLQELWPDLRFVPMETISAPISSSAQLNAVRARRMELLLDKISLDASTCTSHLLDEDFSGAFSANEAALKKHLSNFQLRLQKNSLARKSRGYAVVAETLRSLGSHNVLPPDRDVDETCES
ncbi:hypothetical protein AB1Y20_006816 [Prymnesium parvum]|uniref:SIR2-like domain-containing protein n=1 Tax=Prymnesium parvum TaxID=97485 RepID=A0AB34IZF0_PRYPA